ncbi:MAG: nucleotide exchange factor GrpE [Sporomusaceae bacterium]|nr:nucleotide exchange factor GrpE [Sporomusaceae bacterium]
MQDAKQAGENPETIATAEPVDETVQETCSEDLQRTMSLLEEKSRLVEEQAERYKRLQADFENFRRRSKVEKEELAQVVAESIVVKLLPVIDNFERACSAGTTQDAAAILAGVELIYKQLLSTLEKLDIRQIEAVGAPFDPKLHEAVMTAPDATAAEGTVLEEFQRGYLLGSKAIRPSMVKVSTQG